MLKTVGPLAVTLLALSLAGCGGPTEAEAPPAAPATAGPETGDLLLTGEVVRDGEPVGEATAWIDVMGDSEDVEVGDEVPMWSSDEVTTDEDGHFAVSVDPDVVGSDFWNGEFLNYEVRISDGEVMSQWSTTAFRVDDRVWRSAEQDLVGDAVPHIAFDLGEETVALTDSAGETETGDVLLAPFTTE